jgi:hypothetical protein
MNQTLLIALGVTVFAMTVVGVLIYFYALFATLAEGSNTSFAEAVPLRAANDET